MKGLQKRHKLLTSAVVWMAFLFVCSQITISPNASAATVTGGEARGITHCSTSTVGCFANVTLMYLPYVLNVSNNDTVRFYFHITYEDLRPNSSSGAIHDFQIGAQYLGTGYYRMWQRSTYGNEYGRDTIYLDVPNVREYTTMRVIWEASIEVTSPYCYDYDAEGWYTIMLS